jgi:hypothetical protein
LEASQTQLLVTSEIGQLTDKMGHLQNRAAKLQQTLNELSALSAAPKDSVPSEQLEELLRVV